MLLRSQEATSTPSSGRIAVRGRGRRSRAMRCRRHGLSRCLRDRAAPGRRQAWLHSRSASLRACVEDSERALPARVRGPTAETTGGPSDRSPTASSAVRPLGRSVARLSPRRAPCDRESSGGVGSGRRPPGSGQFWYSASGLPADPGLVGTQIAVAYSQRTALDARSQPDQPSEKRAVACGALFTDPEHSIEEVVDAGRLLLALS